MSPVPTPDAPSIVEKILDDAVRRRASDVHIEPTSDGVEVRMRVDGLLETVAKYDEQIGRSIVTRLMVMAQLLTYRLDVPQEGRARVAIKSAERELNLRLSVMPTTHGLRAALRMPGELVQARSLNELRLPPIVVQGLEAFARAEAGMLILTGPAGSGKTTTIYALLEHIAATSPGLSIVALEDPVERDLPGVTQIQVEPFGELTYERTLRSILRQDPQVLMLGEIRDAATAKIAAEAALSGHRLVTTMHASTPAGAIARLMEMDVPPYVITSGLFGVVAQRLVRRRHESGYRGRLPVAEFVRMDEPLARAIRNHADMGGLVKVYANQRGHRPMHAAGGDLIERGLTDEAELRRALGDAS